VFVHQGAIRTIPWIRRDVTYLNYDVVKQEITKVHKALHREMKTFNVHLHQPVSALLTDSDTEADKSASAECRLRACDQTDVSRFCVDAAEVIFYQLFCTFSQNALPNVWSTLPD